MNYAEETLKILAYVVGAVWVYFNYVRSRTYRPRLVITVDGRIDRTGSPEFVHVSLELKNPGLAKITFAEKGIGVRLCALKEVRDWELLKTFPILNRHQWIEPGETISEALFYAADDKLPGGPMMVEVVVNNVCSRIERFFRRKASTWEASAIIT